MHTKDFIRLGIPLGEATRRATDFVSQFILSGGDKTRLEHELKAIVANPALFAEDPTRKELAKAVVNAPPPPRAEPVKYREWGEGLEREAVMQMERACLLPVAVAGALMPDAHVGYGLPIGGVLATENAVIPYGVGVAIGCSLMLSVLRVGCPALSTQEARHLLLKHTRCGAGVGFEKRDREDHGVLHESTWEDQPLLRHLHDKATAQVGSSGSGNHFVEFGSLTLERPDLGLEAGENLAVLSHSGARGFGAQVANHFTALAQKRHEGLDPAAKKLAWLPLD